MGEWMQVNGESIYGTTASPIGKVRWGRCTAKPGRLYLHVFDWPADGRLEVPEITDDVNKAYLLARKRNILRVTHENGNVIIDVPDRAPDPVNTVIVLEMKSK
jgi:alpha-L-fucosidase